MSKETNHSPRFYNMSVNLEEQTLGFYDQTHPFSNCYPCPIILNNIAYNSVEQAYQAIKLSQHPTIVQQIMTIEDPEEIADFAHNLTELTPQDWADHKIEVMDQIIRAKIYQNLNVRRLLLKSDNWLLYENSPTDTFWGLVDHQEGQNINGQILMQIRFELLQR